jgi:hypothetical protein
VRDRQPTPKLGVILVDGRLFAFELRVPGYTYNEHFDFSSAVERRSGITSRTEDTCHPFDLHLPTALWSWSPALVTSGGK